MPTTAELSHYSQRIEAFFRHCFVYELTRELLCRFPTQWLDVLSAEVDDAGIDFVLRSGDVTRYVQFKTLSKAKTSNPYPVHEALGRMPGGCVIWLCYDPKDMRPIGLHVLGGCGNEPMCALERFEHAKKPKTKVVRRSYRAIRIRNCDRHDLSFGELANYLFPLTNRNVSDEAP